MLRKANKEDLEEVICEFVGNNLKDTAENKLRQKNDYRYKTIFDSWLEAQQYQNKNTELKNRCQFRRFFENFEMGREIAEQDVRTITPTQIEQFMTTLVKEFNLSNKRAREYYTIFFVSVYKHAVRDRIVRPYEDPCIYVVVKRFSKLGRSESNRSADERIIKPETQIAIAEAIRDHHQWKEYYMPPYACELSALTGMRAGELGGLAWSNIDFENGVINITQSMKYDAVSKTWYISDTKNKKKRQFPITDDIMDVLERIQMTQKKYGKTDDYVFSNGKKYYNPSNIKDYLRRVRRLLNIDNSISIHAYRRTFNSQMAAQGVSAHARANLLGHRAMVNEINYTYDAMSLEEKKTIVAQAQKVHGILE